MAQRSVLLSVIIPAHNEAASLPGCHRALKRSVKALGGQAEIIIVDNASTDSTARLSRQLGVRVLSEKRKGVAWARQTGFEAARGEILVSTDADTIVPKTWLATIAELFATHPDVVAVTGNVDFFGARGRRRILLINWLMPLLRRLMWWLSGGCHLMGVNFAIRASVFRAIGGFRTSLRTGEDHDLGLRARPHGKILLSKKITVLSSARKFEGEVSRSVISRFFQIYIANLIWLSVFRRPRTNEFYDVRTRPTLPPAPWTITRLRLALNALFFTLLIMTTLLIGIFVPTSEVFGRTLSRRHTHERIIALTFDDGPNEPYTSQILDILAAKQIKATFFDVGLNVERYPTIAEREVVDGHVVGNHSQDHSDRLILMPTQEAQANLSTAQRTIARVTGHTPHLFRPPYGRKSPWLVTASHHLGLVTIAWSDMTSDWLQPGSTAIAEQIVAQARPGGIIVLHDGDTTVHGANRHQEVAALPRIIDELRARGYQFVTIPQLFGISAYRDAMVSS